MYVCILYVENPKEYIHTQTYTHKLLEPINEFNKVAGYGINIQKHSVSVISNKQSENLIK